MFDYEKKNCCGCTACMNVCPKHAIKMIDDEEGFKYPKIDEVKCIKCGLCEKVCPELNLNNLKNDVPIAYAVKNNNLHIRMCSASGGMFTILAEYIYKKKGVVYGVIFNDNMHVIHERLENIDNIKKARGSKYVQSELNDIFDKVKKDLIDNRIVLFTGTPCQNAGLKMFLKGKYFDNLYLCDIICHGVPSPMLWDSHLKMLENIRKSKILSYNFRDKKIAWRGANVTTSYENNIEKTNLPLEKTYANLYFSHLILRPSCHNCHFTSITRVSDITIGDFWGIEKSMPDFDDNKGVSLVLLNTIKGKKLFEDIKESIVYRSVDVGDCLQPQLQYPSKANPKREKFWNDYKQKGYNYVLKKYTNYGLKNRTIYYFKKIAYKTLKVLKIK